MVSTSVSSTTSLEGIISTHVGFLFRICVTSVVGLFTSSSCIFFDDVVRAQGFCPQNMAKLTGCLRGAEALGKIGLLIFNLLSGLISNLAKTKDLQKGEVPLLIIQRGLLLLCEFGLGGKSLGSGLFLLQDPELLHHGVWGLDPI